MQRQNHKIFPEVTTQAIEENSLMANFPYLARPNRSYSLRDKIGIGYALALGMAVLGATAGLTIGNYQYQQAQHQAIDVDEETRYLGDLHQNLAHTKIHTLQIISLPADSEKLQKDFAQLQEHYAKLKLVWSEIQSGIATTKIKELQPFVKTHGKTIEAYLQGLKILSEQLEPPIEVTTAQQLVSEFAKEDISREVLEVLEGLESVENIGDELEDKTREDLAKAEALRIQIIVVSMGLSSVMAIALALHTSRAIARRMQTLTAIAHQVTQDANFDLQAPVTTADEIGVLATSLNQLIQQVKHLLEEQKAAGERQLLQNEKLATLGRMLAGVAHELNNPLCCIYGNLTHANNYFENLLVLIDTYQSEIPHPPAAVVDRTEEIELDFILEDLPQVLQAMKIAAERAKGIIQSLKNFSRLDEATPHSVDLHSCLDSTLLILHNRIKLGITVVCNYGEVPEIEGYAGMLSQVFMNVLSNAIEALQEQGGNFRASPCIIITTERLDADGVVVRIADNGSGITPEHQVKIFDTFFTTKPRDVGTGLGLAISRQIVVEKHGGKISCSSELSKGTEFAIALPIKHFSRHSSVFSNNFSH